MVIDNTAHFDRAEKLAGDPERVRRDFWLKFKRVAVKLPFAEDLLAAYYCAFDRETPRQVQAAIWPRSPISCCRLISVPDMLPVLGLTPLFLRPPSAWSQAISRRSIARRLMRADARAG
jgi:hypothetical protein